MKLNKIISGAYLIISMLIIFNGCKSDNENLIAKGTEKFDKGDVLNASQDFLAITTADPGNIKAHLKFASAGAYLNSDYELFYNNLKKIGNISPEFKNLFFFTIEARSNTDLQNMVKYSEQTLGKKIINKAVAEEIDAVTSAINKNPNNPYFYFTRGLWNGQFCNYEGAIKDFSSAIELKKDFWQAYFMRGVFYNHINFWQANDNEFKDNLKAINDFNRVAALNPSFAAVNHKLFLLHLNLDNTKESLNAIEKLYLSDTTKHFYLLKKAELEARDGKHKESVDDYNLLVKKDPDNIHYLYGLAIETIAVGKKAEGINLLKKALAQCNNRNWENKIMKAIETESAKDTKTGKGPASGSKDEFIKLYLTAQEKLKEGKKEEGIALLKKAEPMAINNYYKKRISSILRSEHADRRTKERDSKKGNEKNKTYREHFYRQGKEYIESGNLTNGVRSLKIALKKCRDNEVRIEISDLIKKAEAKLPTVRKINTADKKNEKKIGRIRDNYNEHYYISGKQKLAAGRTKEGIEELKMAYKVCPRNDIRKEIKELLHKAGKN